jgi:hypothetical protein
MGKYLYTLWAALVLLGLAGAWQGKAQDKASGVKTLKVKLHYSGAGTVDEKHKIFVFVFDSPDFVQRQDAVPIANDSGTAKDAILTFSNVAASPVYLIAVYDPAGAYEGMSRPPAGSSLGIFAKTPGQVDPVSLEAGKIALVELAFDDTVKMP